MAKQRYFIVGVLIFLIALLCAGCETMNPEWSGEMPNESGPHVQPQNIDAPSENNSESLRPLMLLNGIVAPALRVSPAARRQSNTAAERSASALGQFNFDFRATLPSPFPSLISTSSTTRP